MSVPSLQSSPYLSQPSSFERYHELESQIQIGNYEHITKFCTSEVQTDDKIQAFHHLCGWRVKPSEHDLIEKICKSLEIFISHGFDINSLSRSRETALHIACRQGNLKITEFLLLNGAKRDSTALQIAEEGKIEEIVKLLKKEDLIFINNVNVLKFLMLSQTSLIEVEKAIKAKAAFLIGDSGAGKTTLINWMDGCYYNTDEDIEFVGEKETISTSKKSSSDTVTIKTYGDKIDGPGFEDNRGDEYELSAGVSFCRLFDSGAVKNLIVVIPAYYFQETRFKKLKSVCLRIGNMISDYDKIAHSIYFVISQQDQAAKFPKNVTKFIEFLKEKVISLISKETRSEECYLTLGCLNLINEKNLLLADYNIGTDQLRSMFLARLKEMPSVPPEALKSGLDGNQRVKLQSIANVFFNTLVKAIKDEALIKGLLEIKQERIDLAKEDLENLEIQIRTIESKVFEAPKEGPNNSEEFRKYLEGEIAKVKSNIEALEKKIDENAKKIVDIQQKPQGTINKSLKDLEEEIKKLKADLLKYDSDNWIEFYHEHFTEKRKWLGKLFGWSYHKFEYVDKDKPYEKANYEANMGYFKKGIEDKPTQGIFKAEYETSIGEDGDAQIKINGKMKVKYKDEIESLKKKIHDLQLVIDEKYKLIEELRERNEEIKKQISKEEQRKTELLDQIKNLNSEVLQAKNAFEARVKWLKEDFERVKREQIQQIQSQISRLVKILADLGREFQALSKSGKLAEEYLKYVKATYDPDKIKTMSQVINISKILSVAFEEYKQISDRFRQLDKETHPEEYVDNLFKNPLKKPVRHLDGCNKVFEEAYVTNLLAIKALCPFCRKEIKKEHLEKDEELEKEIAKWEQEQTEQLVKFF